MHSKYEVIEQVLFMDQWMDKEHVRTFMWNKEGEQILANSWDEYQELAATGLWFLEPQKEEVVEKPKARKPKNGADS